MEIHYSNCAPVLSFIIHIIAQPFFKFWMLCFLPTKCPTVTISLLKSHFVFAQVTNTTFTHIILSSHSTVSNVFCFFNYPKLFFCCERAITRSCSHSQLNTWFTLHSLKCYWSHMNWGDNNASIMGSFVRGGAVMRAPHFSLLNSEKKNVWNICLYTILLLIIGLGKHRRLPPLYRVDEFYHVQQSLLQLQAMLWQEKQQCR